MTSEPRYQRVKQIFLHLVDLEPEARAVALAEACQGDAEIEAEVRALLRLAEAPTGWLQPALTADTAESRPTVLTAKELRGLITELRDWGRFVDLEPLGAGGMGAVLKAFDPRLRRPVALKLLTHIGQENADRFRREAQLQARVDHHNVLEIFETGEACGHPYIAMRLVEGPALLEIGSRASFDQLTELMQRVAEGLDAAHQLGLVHRDVKPGNILIERRTEGWWPYVADFGIATDQPSSGDRGLIGSPRYMAPEQLEGRTADLRADLYSLGATFYEMIAGQPPFSGDSLADLMVEILTADLLPLKQVAPQVPTALAATVERCLERDPERRFADAAELAKALAELRAARHRVRRRTAALIAVATGALAVVLGTSMLEPRSAKDPDQSALQPTEAEATRLLAEGNERLRHQDARAAQRAFERALASAPEDPLLHLGLSRALDRLGQASAAEEHLEQATAHADELDEVGHLEIEAQRWVLDKNWQSARATWQRLRELRPDELDYGLGQAEAELALGDYRQTLQTVETLAELPSSFGRDPRIALLESRALTRLGNFDAALEAALRGRDLAEEISAPNLVYESRSLEAWAWRNLGDLEAAHEAAYQAKVIAKAAAHPRGVISAQTTRGLIFRAQGDLDSALVEYDQALKQATELQDRPLISTLHNNIAVALADRGELDEALFHYQASAKIERQLDRPQKLAINRLNIGMNRAYRGEHRIGLQHYRQALAMFRQLEDRRGQALTLARMAELSVWTGALGQAEEQSDASREIALEIGLQAAASSQLNVRGWIHLARLEPDRAAAAHQQALDAFRQLGVQADISISLTSLGRADCERGRLEAARDALQEALAIANSAKLTLWAADARLGLAELALASSHFETATEHLRAAEEDYRAAANADGLYDIERIRCEVELAADRLDQARTAADRMVELAAGLPHRLAQAGRARAAVQLRLGDLAGAERHLGSARQALAEIEHPRVRYEIEQLTNELDLAKRNSRLGSLPPT